MFIITAKFNKRKVIAALLILVALVAVIVICLSSGGDEASPASISAAVKNNSQRVAYLRSLGWEVSEDPIDTQTITIPRDFNEVYEEYNELQLSQGFDLSKYCGLEAVRYTYQVTNHPTADGSVVADIIVYRNQVIAGDIQSISSDGFMAGLVYPAGNS
ncbi:MAG: DUF4830 domain-containing protein [Oscillospiraceae bacterium]